MKYGLSEEQLAQINTVLASYQQVERAVIFGSRAIGTYKEASDVDIAVKGALVDAHLAARLKNGLEEDTDLPFFFDIAAYNTVDFGKFKEHIKTKGKVIYCKEWREVKLGDIGSFSGGVTSIKKKDYGFGTPFLQYTNVYRNWKVDIDKLELMNVRGQDLKRKNCIYGDIFFTASSETKDEVAISSVLLDDVKNLTYNAFCKRYRLFNFNTLLPEFARYLFRSQIFRGEVYKKVTGDVRFNISQASLADISVALPPVREQKAIAEVLSGLDEKIDLLHRQNKTLEDIAQMLFNKRFVEDANDMWKKVSIGDSDLSKIISSGIEKFEAEKIYLATADVQGGKIEKTDTKITYINRPSRANMQPVEYSVWFAKKGGVRKVLMFDKFSQKYAKEIILSTGFGGLKTNALSHYYIWCYIAGFDNIKDTLLSGSVQPDINNEGIRSILIPRPDNGTLEKFNKVVEPNFHKIFSNLSQIRILENLRDALLPKLMSGEICIEMKNKIRRKR